MTKRSDQFQTIRTEGALLPTDILQSIASLKVDGVSPESYHLPPGTKLNEAIAHSWSVLQKHWKGFQEARLTLVENATGTELTNQHWLLPLFEELKYGRLVTGKSPEIDGRIYPIERAWADQPIHLIGCNLPLDRRTEGARGAATASPHSMMQEYLNRSENSLWGFLSNGRTFRILRDNVSLSRQAYVEFDVEAMMEGEVYGDFAILWMLCHQSRIEADKPHDFWLEKWSQLAREQGTRVLADLRNGVAKAIAALGRGFIAHPRNDTLREKLHSGRLDTQEYYRQLLRTVYRLLFLFVAEDRRLLHPADADSDACQRYESFYSTRRLRDLADHIRGSKHADLWHTLSLVFDALGDNAGCPELGLPPMGSFLWRRATTPDLLGPAPKDREPTDEPVLISNDDLLTAVRALAYVVQDKVRRAVDYRNLGSEELGSVYESLLELHPVMNVPARTFELSIAAGNERKTTGSYYTPDSLVQCLLDSALEPVVADRLDEVRRLASGEWRTDEEEHNAYSVLSGSPAQSPEPESLKTLWNKTPLPTRRSLLAEQALLDLKVCDPACGSGHFLIAAAHRLARHLARIRTGESEPSPEDHQHALRDIIGRCIYGVDINPMAVELCKVSLWMEAIEPGRPLSFLDHHIQCGNSLLGTTPALLKDGIPDNAFKPIEGDVKAVASELKKQNKKERKDRAGGQLQNYLYEPYIKLGNLPGEFTRLSSSSDDSVADVAEKERRYAELVSGTDYQNARLLADLWCAVFVWRKDDSELGKLCPTERDFRNIENNPHSILPQVKSEVRRLADQYQLFHWHLAFPDVFRLPAEGRAENEQTGWNRGFDVVLGNPPWERIKIQEKEWFSQRAPEIANAKNAASRRKQIAALADTEPQLLRDFEEACRVSEAQSHLFRDSDRYPMCGRGDINTYMIFSELNQSVIGPSGRAGFIVPSGIATDDTTKFFFQFLIRNGILVSLFDFRNKGFFGDVAGAQGNRFALVALAGIDMPVSESRFMFRGESISDLSNAERVFTLNERDVATMNPNTLTCPVFQSQRDAEIVKRVYRSMPVLHRTSLADSNDWTLRIRRVLDMNKSDVLAQCVPEPDGNSADWVPVCESKMMHQFDAKFGTYEGVALTGKGVRQIPTPDSASRNDPRFQPKPRYWIRTSDLVPRIADDFDGQWLLVWRDITSNVDFRTVIASVIPFMGTDFTLRMATVEPKSHVPSLAGLLNSFAFDYVTRQKLGGTHLSDYISFQLPVPTPDSFLDPPLWDSGTTFRTWAGQRVLELTYTAWDLEAFALDCGYAGPPFRWDKERRFLLRCELDAAYFHLYLGPPAEWGTDSPQLREMFPTPRDAVDYIMETFPIVKRKDIKRTEIKDDKGDVTTEGTYITKDTILAIYDEMQTAIETGKPYQTRLTPPPGPPTDAEGNFIPMAEWDEDNWPSHIHPPRESAERTG